MPRKKSDKEFHERNIESLKKQISSLEERRAFQVKTYKCETSIYVRDTDRVLNFYKNQLKDVMKEVIV